MPIKSENIVKAHIVVVTRLRILRFGFPNILLTAIQRLSEAPKTHGYLAVEYSSVGLMCMLCCRSILFLDADEVRVNSSGLSLISRRLFAEEQWSYSPEAGANSIPD